jgi:group I intron endonuclease
MSTGVYCIRNLITGEFYIGSAAIGFVVRWNQHRSHLRRNKHRNYRLQAAWRFYGESSFRFAVVEECPPEKCIEREQWFIDIFDPAYNICRVAGAVMAGRSLSPAHRAKIGAANRGHAVSPEVRAKLRAFNLGRKASPETCAKLSACHMGNKYCLGYKHDAAFRAKVSAATLGRKRSPETRARMCIAQSKRTSHYWLGRKHAPETKAKMRAAQLGKKKSEVHCAHLRAAWVLRKARSMNLSAPSIPLAVPVVPV